MAQRTSEKRGWKYSKSQNTLKSSVETVSPRDGCINKTRRIAISMAILHGREEIPWDPTPRPRSKGHCWLLGEEWASPRCESHYRLFGAEWSALKPRTHTLIIASPGYCSHWSVFPNSALSFHHSTDPFYVLYGIIFLHHIFVVDPILPLGKILLALTLGVCILWCAYWPQLCDVTASGRFYANRYALC